MVVLSESYHTFEDSPKAPRPNKDAYTQTIVQREQNESLFIPRPWLFNHLYTETLTTGI